MAMAGGITSNGNLETRLGLMAIMSRPLAGQLGVSRLSHGVDVQLGFAMEPPAGRVVVNDHAGDPFVDGPGLQRRPMPTVKANTHGTIHVRQGLGRRRHRVPNLWQHRLQDLQLELVGDHTMAAGLGGKLALAGHMAHGPKASGGSLARLPMLAGLGTGHDGLEWHIAISTSKRNVGHGLRAQAMCSLAAHGLMTKARRTHDGASLASHGQLTAHAAHAAN